jgi:hypothetical protein
VKIRLCDEDRALFGCDEWLDPASVLAISINDLDELAGRFEFDPSDWPEPLFGQLTLDQAGVEGAKPKPPPWRSRAQVWMLLRQNGYDVSWEDVGKAHPLLMTNDVVDPSPGKDPAPSPNSAASTTRRSRTSAGSRTKRPSTG